MRATFADPEAGAASSPRSLFSLFSFFSFFAFFSFFSFFSFPISIERANDDARWRARRAGRE